MLECIAVLSVRKNKLVVLYLYWRRNCCNKFKLWHAKHVLCHVILRGRVYSVIYAATRSLAQGRMLEMYHLALILIISGRMNVTWWRIEWCWYTYLHTFLSAELLSLSRVMRRHGVQFIDWGLHRCRLYSCCCCCCCHSSWWWWWWWQCLLLPWQACFVWHYIMLPALSLLQTRLDIVMLLVAMTSATMHGVSRSEQRSLCCTVHFLLTVLSAHCCAFSVFFLNSCCIFSYTTAAAADRTFMVTLMISETVSVFFVFMPLPL